MMTRLLSLSLLIIISMGAHARFLGQDPAAGDVRNPPSLHKYLYAYQNPTVYVDPDGRTAEQFQTLMTTSIERFRTSGNRTALGTAGELHLERLLKANGEVVIKGPATSPGQHNADVVSYNPDTGKVSFFDNKVQTLKANVSRANNLSTDKGRQKSITEALGKLKEMDLSAKDRKKIRGALEAVAHDPSKAIWAVANATPDELTEVNNKVKRVSQRLTKKGVRLADVVGDKINILSAEHSSSNGKKALTKLGKALPGAGMAVLATVATTRLNAAAQEDAAFRQAMQELGIPSSHFDHHSLQRESAIIAGEAAGGEGGGAGGAAAVAPFSAGCGLAAPLCIGAGAIVGGLAGDTIGGKLAERAFDKNAQRSAPGEVERIKQKIREMRSQGPLITVEDPSGPGGF